MRKHIKEGVFPRDEITVRKMEMGELMLSVHLESAVDAWLDAQTSDRRRSIANKLLILVNMALEGAPQNPQLLKLKSIFDEAINSTVISLAHKKGVEESVSKLRIDYSSDILRQIDPREFFLDFGNKLTKAVEKVRTGRGNKILKLDALTKKRLEYADEALLQLSEMMDFLNQENTGESDPKWQAAYAAWNCAIAWINMNSIIYSAKIKKRDGRSKTALHIEYDALGGYEVLDTPYKTFKLLTKLKKEGKLPEQAASELPSDYKEFQGGIWKNRLKPRIRNRGTTKH